MKALRSKRVVLRPVRPDDVVRHREFSADHELAWLDSNNPQNYPQMVEEFLSGVVHDDAHFGIVVEGDYIGYCSLIEVATSIYELGIVIGSRGHWNGGLGRETVRLLLAHGFSDLGASAIELTTNAKNERAIRCFQAAGFVERLREARAIPYEGDLVDMIEMSIDRNTWASHRQPV